MFVKWIYICTVGAEVCDTTHQGSRGSTERLGSLEGEKAKKIRRIMRRRGSRRSVDGGGGSGGSGGRNGGRIRRSRETKRRTATDLAVIKELPVKPIGLGVMSTLSR
ncbi:unnamed protein product [Brassica oleracea]